MGNKRKSILLITGSIIVILIIGLFLTLSIPSAPPPMPLPSPNGYTSFLNAASRVQKSSLDIPKMTPAQLQSFVDANSNALAIARAGLAEKSRVSVEYSQAYPAKHLPELANLKWLAYAFMAEGRLNEMDQRPRDAANSYLDLIHLGIESRKGGPLIDVLVGIAIEDMGTSDLEKLAPNLDAKTAAELARELENISTQAETWQDVLDNENNWSRRAFPGLQNRIAAILAWNSMKASKAKARSRFVAQETRTRRLMLNLAAHAYELGKGHRPGSVADLVPEYLNAIPKDRANKNMTLTP